jgi:predicted  nucleic acid-binding Zn-ribbon protein
MIAKLKTEFSKQKSEEIDNLQRSQFHSYEHTINHLRKELHEIESKLDEQNRLSQSFIRLKNIFNVDAPDHDEVINQLVQKMERFQLLNNDLTKEKSDLQQQFDHNKDELNRTKQEFLTNKNKYENQINQLNQQIQNEKHSINIQFENLQKQFNDKTHQYDQLQTNFEQLSKYEKDLQQQQILNDNLRREFNDLHDELKSKTNEILSLQTDLNKLQQTLQNKINEIEQLSQDKLSLTEDNQRKEKVLSEQKQFNEVHTALEEKFNNILTEKAGLENELDKIRVQMQTTESTLNKKKQDQIIKLEQSEQKIKELQVKTF